MDSEPEQSQKIALNVTRTRVTVLVFNMTIIALMLSITSARSSAENFEELAHLSSSAALFAGFCLTLLGLWWLLHSQNWDAQGFSRAWPFTMGAITTYLALSQTVTAFVHEYLIGIKVILNASRLNPANHLQTMALDDFSESGLLILFVIGSIIWFLITYAAPVMAGLKSPARNHWRGFFILYYVALQIPVYWVYAKVWQIQLAVGGETATMTELFFLQFVQPLLWFR